MLNPEKLTLLDPACGSGHILVEAYDLFKAIYTERGYPKREIPRLILEKNLFGLEIDDRAAQLASFALMMKARADDRRIFESGVKPNVLAFQESLGLNAADIARALNAPINKDDVPREFLFEEMQEERDGLFSQKAMAEKGHVSPADIAALVELFENAKTFGSLIQVPPKLAAKLPEIEKRLDDVLKHGDLMHASAHVLKPLLQQARWLAMQYDAVVANPPYMGRGGMNVILRDFVDERFPNSKHNLFSVFMERLGMLTMKSGAVAMVTMQNWMFLSRFTAFRTTFLRNWHLDSLLHLGARAFDSISGEVVQTAAFTFWINPSQKKPAHFFRLVEGDDSESKERAFLSAAQNTASPLRFNVATERFRVIQEEPLCYWATDREFLLFEKNPVIGKQLAAREGMATGSNGLFLRLWHEVALNRAAFGCSTIPESVQSGRKWFPYNKGGGELRWFGNNDYFVNWQNDGEEIRGFTDERTGRIRSHNYNGEYSFREGVSWSSIGSGRLSARYSPVGFLFDAKGTTAFAASKLLFFTGLLNSLVGTRFISLLSPTLDFKLGHILSVPVVEPQKTISSVADLVEQSIARARADWDNFETSWDFRDQPLLRLGLKGATLEASWQNWEAHCTAAIRRMQELETENNRLFIAAYGLEGELQPEVSEDQITLYRPNREEDIKRLLSYAIGCMMGRYSLDQPGLIYAHSGNVAFEKIYFATETHGRNTEKTQDLSSSVSFPCPSVAKFLPDQDGIIPLLTTDWGFPDDATTRLVEFISVAWPKEHLEENLKFIADSLGSISNEQPRDTIRRYFAAGFYKHHLTIYKRRPIYWLFASGKQRAFQCLVYLHRYHDGTLARMRTEYVIPLQGRIAARIEQLEDDKTKATSTSHRKKLQKEQDDLKKQQAELLTFEEKLKHAADQKISLDLDDGVKVNYGKFGELLAESKAITGGKDED